MNNSDASTDSLWEQIKQVLREFFRGGKERVSGIAGTIDRQAGIRKLAAQIGLLRRERHQRLLTMGKKAYSLHTRGKVRNRDILEDCLRIDEIEVEISEFQDRIEEIRRQAGPEEDLLVELEDEQPVAEEAEVQADETEEDSAQLDEEENLYREE
jgi:hypothetical protein